MDLCLFIPAALEDIADATLSSAVLIAGQSSAIAATSTPPPTDDAEAQLSAAFAGLLSDSAFDAAAAASAALNTVNLGQEYMAALLKW